MESEIRPGRFQVLPVVIKNLIIINALVWLAQITVGRDLLSIEDLFALHHFSSVHYHFWQFITYMFLHSSDSFFHILFNMFALWMFGSTLENLWGPAKFLSFYLVCGLGAGLTQAIALMPSPADISSPRIDGYVMFDGNQAKKSGCCH